jgi:osmotically-inducible protein OsmY
MNDIRLRREVLDTLEFEPGVEAAHIGVQIVNGIATLTGHVQSHAQRVAAIACVWRTKGVRAVVQEIEVRPMGESIGDELIAERALNLLRWDSTVPHTVHVTVSQGWLTLSGDVEWQYQRDNAEIDLHRLSGVAGITNDIKVVPRTFLQPNAVRLKIEDALKRNAEVEADRIYVDVTGDGTVCLTGRVQSLAERVAVERAAWSAPGVSAVADDLIIG